MANIQLPALSTAVSVSPTDDLHLRQGATDKKLAVSILRDYILGELDLSAIQAALVPTGLISMWSGTIANIPAGWFLCDGTNGTPNLADKFVLGTTTNAQIGNTGGSKDIAVTGTTDGHALTAAQTIRITTVESLGGSFSNGVFTIPGDGTYSSFIKTENNDGVGGDTGIRMKTNAASSAHSHNLNVTLTDKNLPPYYKLAFIMKG